VYSRLKQFRESLGLTQAEFGSSIGIAKTTYNNYEIVVVENNSETKEIFEYYKEIVADTKIKVLNYNKNIILTKHEFELLKALIKNPNQALTKSMLFDIVWGDESFADENTLNVHISKIRNKNSI